MCVPVLDPVGGRPSEAVTYYTFHATNAVENVYATPSANFMTLTPDATMFLFR